MYFSATIKIRLKPMWNYIGTKSSTRENVPTNEIQKFYKRKCTNQWEARFQQRKCTNQWEIPV
jgi:hypothetical protein